ncbi:MAG: hypothetical protein JXA90_06610, partial [Planctomycetes bacterium]|nr:hypothetical protein [Planctomycetota bacterium]
MLRQHSAVWRATFIALDLTISALAFLGAYWIRFGLEWAKEVGDVPPFRAYLQVLPVLALILWITNSHFQLYLPRRTTSFIDEMGDVVKSNFAAALLLMTFFFMNRSFSYSRTTVAIFALLNPMAVISFRLGLRLVLRSLRARGYNMRSALIVGTGRTAQELLHRLRKNPWTGIRLAGLISRSAEMVGTSVHGIPVIGSTAELDSVLDRHEIDQVYLALPASQKALLEDIARRLSERFVALRIVPDISYYVSADQLTNF